MIELGFAFPEVVEPPLKNRNEHFIWIFASISQRHLILNCLPSSEKITARCNENFAKIISSSFPLLLFCSPFERREIKEFALKGQVGVRHQRASES